MKVLLVDFEDSFSWNIYQWIKSMSSDVMVVHYSDFETAYRKVSPDVVVLGPGPGHPLEYSKFLSNIEQCFRDKVFLYGICLGHQLIHTYLGNPTRKREMPIHGRPQKILLNEISKSYLKCLAGSVSVQYYSSLTVKVNSTKRLFVVNDLGGDCAMTWSDEFFSCQFHPESVGTRNNQLFLTPIHNFAYNGRDGKQNANRWHLRRSHGRCPQQTKHI